MSLTRILRRITVALIELSGVILMSVIATRAQSVGTGDKKPNILFIMGDDIGWMQVGVYHRGIGLGETPNIDRLAHEGGMFTTYYAMQSCTTGRNVFREFLVALAQPT